MKILPLKMMISAGPVRVPCVEEARDGLLPWVKMMNFVWKTRNCVSKTRELRIKSDEFCRPTSVHSTQRVIVGATSEWFLPDTAWREANGEQRLGVAYKYDVQVSILKNDGGLLSNDDRPLKNDEIFYWKWWFLYWKMMVFTLTTADKQRTERWDPYQGHLLGVYW